MFAHEVLACCPGCLKPLPMAKRRRFQARKTYCGRRCRTADRRCLRKRRG